MKRALLKRIITRDVFISGVLVILTMACSGPGGQGSSGPVIFFAGSSDRNLKNSIFLCELDTVIPAIIVIDSFPANGGSGYIDLSPCKHTLFATSRAGTKGEAGSDAVAAFRVNQNDHTLELINRQSSQGTGICHVRSSPSGNYVFAANYTSGHVAALPVGESGRLGSATSVVKGEGSGPVKSRQEGPHAHQAMMDPGGKYLLVPDLGTDKVMNYAFNCAQGILTPNRHQPFLKMDPGSGPRHLAFHPSGEFVFILGEMSATLTACSYKAESGVLSIINTASIVEEGFQGKRQSAAVRVHPNGKFIYASNRDSVSNLAVFKMNGQDGIERIQILDRVPYWPRDFNITPDGTFLLVAGARSNEISIYKLDPQRGLLTGTGVKTIIPGITSIVFL